MTVTCCDTVASSVVLPSNWAGLRLFHGKIEHGVNCSFVGTLLLLVATSELPHLCVTCFNGFQTSSDMLLCLTSEIHKSVNTNNDILPDVTKC